MTTHAVLSRALEIMRETLDMDVFVVAKGHAPNASAEINAMRIERFREALTQAEREEYAAQHRSHLATLESPIETETTVRDARSGNVLHKCRTSVHGACWCASAPSSSRTQAVRKYALALLDSLDTMRLSPGARELPLDYLRASESAHAGFVAEGAGRAVSEEARADAYRAQVLWSKMNQAQRDVVAQAREAGLKPGAFEGAI